MRWQYAHLNETPYLYSSKHLRQMYKESHSNNEIESIWNHMQRYEVAEDKQYKGYYRLGIDIKEDLYGEEVEEMEWDQLVKEYYPVMTKSGLKFQKKGDLL